MSQRFKGPFFIIGKPRSGTKLLARIFEQHPNIAIEVSETQFIPYYLTNRHFLKDLHIKKNFDRFYKSVIRSTYFAKYHKNHIAADEWYNLCTDYSFYDVLEVLLKYYSNQLHNLDAIWGDKSNNYITHVKLLKQHFPTSKFIHIVRDVRDAGLSSFNAWRTNVYRYSQRWFNDISQMCRDLQEIPATDYIEIKYEDLLQHPDNTIERCMELLGLEFFNNMLTFREQSEAVGDAKGMRRIKQDNFEKYKKYYSKTTISRIEEITWPLLHYYGYDYEYDGPVKTIPRVILTYYQSLDVMNRFMFDFKESGVKNVFNILKGHFFHFKQTRMRM